MDITLIKSINGDEIHATDNGKKTGCGINLLKSENVSKFISAGNMSDLKEITCDKCKTVVAKKIIKADKKEMAKLIKEEKINKKKGIVDDGIVPLGNTQAKITAAPKKEEPQVTPASAPVAPVQNNVGVGASAPEPTAAPPMPKTIPGTGVAIDSDLAAFAINVPKPQEQNSKPEVKDDFLAQFAINKPNEQNEVESEQTHTAEPIQDDFLAQFAIKSPNGQEQNTEQTSDYKPEEYNAIDEQEIEEEAPQDIEADYEAEYTPEIIDESEMNDISSESLSEEDNDYSQDILTDENVEMAEPNDNVSDEELMQMFSISSSLKSGSEVEVVSDKETDESSIYDEDESVVDVDANEMTDIEDSDNEEAQPVEEEEEQLVGNLDWDMVANQLFGASDVEQPKNEIEEIQTMEETSEPEIEEIPTMEETSESELEEIPTMEETSEPEIEEIPTMEETSESELEEIPTMEETSESEFEEIPTMEETSEPEFEEIPTMEETSEPELEETLNIEEIAAQELDSETEDTYSYNDYAEERNNKGNMTPLNMETLEMDSIGDADEMKKQYKYSAPIFADENTKAQQTIKENIPVEPIQTTSEQPLVTPMSAPIQPMTAAPTQMSQYAQPEQPMIMPVPQFAGYDMNGQPIYTYVQSQFLGYDAGGQPIFAPIQPVPPVQPMEQPVQPIAPIPPVAAPVQSVPFVQPVEQPVQPIAPIPPVAAPVQSVPPVQPMEQPVQPIAPIPPVAAPVQPIPPVQPVEQPVQPIAPIQPAAAPVQPTEAPVQQHVYQQAPAFSQVNISKIATETHRAMPKSVANAVANSKAKSNKNIFDMQGAQMPVLGSIEEALSQMGDEVVQKKRAEEKAMPAFEQYKAPTRSSSSNTSSTQQKPEKPDRPLTKAELKAMKKQEKIDQKFKKDLAKRGF